MLIHTNAAQLVVSLAGDQSRAAFVNLGVLKMLTLLPKSNSDDDPIDRTTAENVAATRAAGLWPCLACGKPAAVFLSCDALQFRAERCDDCAQDVIAYAAASGADVSLRQLVGVPLASAIDGVEVAQFVREVLDGVVGDLPVPAAPTVPQATALTVTVLESKLRRPLAPSEVLAVEYAATAEAARRFHQRKADLVAAQTAFASPFSAFARRVG